MSNARVGESERHAKGFLYTGILLLWLRALAGKAFAIRKRRTVRISKLVDRWKDKIRKEKFFPFSASLLNRNTPRRNHVSLVSQHFARTLAQDTPKSAVVS